MNKIIISLLNFYHYFLSFDGGLLSFLAPGGACKYSPTCSFYTRQMVEKHGIIKGLELGLRRILSCH